MRYVFGACILDTEQYVLNRAGYSISLQPKVFQVLEGRIPIFPVRAPTEALSQFLMSRRSGMSEPDWQDNYRARG
jgi:hypothetical protein